jgi:hypothetical protein
MSFGRKYNTRLPQLTERIHDFLRTKHLTGLVEHEFQNVNEPTGWATLMVDTADPQLQNELDGFISNLERIAVRQSEIDTLNKVQIAIRLLGKEMTKFGK